MKTAKAINRLKYIIDIALNLLTDISEENFSIKHSSTKWSKKEILGHLIDSATINHHRFVRGQFEKYPEIIYDQNKWNTFGFYQEIHREQLINFWTIYNSQLLEIIKRISSNNLTNQIRIGNDFLTLQFLINDYVEHLEHHLKKIIEY